MSRESYARGFCKAAEAAGVDPKALAKFAQAKYETGGRAPEGAPAAGSGRIPEVGLDGSVGPMRTPWALWYESKVTSPQLQALRNIPWFRNWHDSHTNIISRLNKGMGEPDFTAEFSKDALKALAEQYDKGMKANTNYVDKVELRPKK